jgi:hypothetical protein
MRSIGIAVVLMTALASCGATPAGHAVPPRDQALREVLGTLRRPRTTADLGDGRLRRQLRFMSRHPRLAGTPVRDLVRFATVAPWGQKVFLVPSRPPGRRGHALTLSAPATANATVAQIEAGGDWGTERSDQLLIVVPDGVARVTVRPVRTSTDRHPSPVTATVHGNVAAFQSNQNLDDPQREIWYGPSGHVIERIALSIAHHGP